MTDKSGFYARKSNTYDNCSRPEDYYFLFANKKDFEGKETEWPRYDHRNCGSYFPEMLKKESEKWQKTGKTYPLLSYDNEAQDVNTTEYDEYVDDKGERFIVTPGPDKESYIQRKVEPLNLAPSFKNPEELVLDINNGGVGLLWVEDPFVKPACWRNAYIKNVDGYMNDYMKKIDDYVKNVFSKRVIKETDNQKDNNMEHSVGTQKADIKKLRGLSSQDAKPVKQTSLSPQMMRSNPNPRDKK